MACLHKPGSRAWGDANGRARLGRAGRWFRRANDYALAVVHESLKLTGRNGIIILSDQENTVKKLASMVRDSRPQETVLLNTPGGLQCQRRRH